jgi:hypothetical protein
MLALKKCAYVICMHIQEGGDVARSHSCEPDGEPPKSTVSRTTSDGVKGKKPLKSNMRYVVHGQTGEYPVGG